MLSLLDEDNGIESESESDLRMALGSTDVYVVGRRSDCRDGSATGMSAFCDLGFRMRKLGRVRRAMRGTYGDLGRCPSGRDPACVCGSGNAKCRVHTGSDALNRLPERLDGRIETPLVTCSPGQLHRCGPPPPSGMASGMLPRIVPIDFW